MWVDDAVMWTLGLVGHCALELANWCFPTPERRKAKVPREREDEDWSMV